MIEIKWADEPQLFLVPSHFVQLMPVFAQKTMTRCLAVAGRGTPGCGPQPRMKLLGRPWWMKHPHNHDAFRYAEWKCVDIWRWMIQDIRVTNHYITISWWFGNQSHGHIARIETTTSRFVVGIRLLVRRFASGGWLAVCVGEIPIAVANMMAQNTKILAVVVGLMFKWVLKRYCVNKPSYLYMSPCFSPRY